MIELYYTQHIHCIITQKIVLSQIAHCTHRLVAYATLYFASVEYCVDDDQILVYRISTFINMNFIFIKNLFPKFWIHFKDITDNNRMRSFV